VPATDQEVIGHAGPKIGRSSELESRTRAPRWHCGVRERSASSSMEHPATVATPFRPAASAEVGRFAAAFRGVPRRSASLFRACHPIVEQHVHQAAVRARLRASLRYDRSHPSQPPAAAGALAASRDVPPRIALLLRACHPIGFFGTQIDNAVRLLAEAVEDAE
jgi:hypothetical protein